ncbi:CASP-like protein 4A1 [Cucumis melo]|uniref:CASP-like protein n=2 Tax=Cucumis melo TaxID=3656 RepID=A0ABM3KKT6_CUCME|nr:CASP-like protein 4A1 [Cucumis melo]
MMNPIKILWSLAFNATSESKPHIQIPITPPPSLPQISSTRNRSPYAGTPVRSRSVAANRAQPSEPIVVTKVDTEIQGVRKVEEVSDSDGDGDVESADGGKVGRRRKLMESLSIKKIKKEELRKKILLGFRICGFAFCLVSVSVMASDKDQGWASDSFYRYKEFRYCMAVNVIGFVYSALQSYDLVYFLSTGKHMIRNHFKQ